MKKIIQLFLFIFLILISIFFYNTYFQNEKFESKKKIQKTNQNLEKDQSNLIKNLKYEVKFDDNTEYLIKADLSKIIYENEAEIVEMQVVDAKFIGSNMIPFKIKSDNALYNNFTYDTKFFDNVTLEYLNNTMLAKNLDLNFTENIITIYNNVVYEGDQGIAKADNVRINLDTKNVEIFMNDKENKVEVISN